MTSEPASVTITAILTPAATFSTSSLNLGSEPAGSIGPEQTFTVTDTGSSQLDISGVQPSGAEPGDYLIGNDHVLRTASLHLTRQGNVVRQSLGRLSRGRYTLTVTTRRGRQSETVLRLAFRVR